MKLYSVLGKNFLTRNMNDIFIEGKILKKVNSFLVLLISKMSVLIPNYNSS